jgi:hypothetical protein
MAIGLASRLPNTLYSGLTQAGGVSPGPAHTIAHVPPVGTLFAAFLGDNPTRQLMQQVDPAQLQPGSGVDVARLTGKALLETDDDEALTAHSTTASPGPTRP